MCCSVAIIHADFFARIYTVGAGAIIIPAMAPRTAVGPSVYPLAQVLAGLQRQPRAWVGRTVYVRGWIVGNGAYNICAHGRVAPSCPLVTWVYLAPQDTHHGYSVSGGPPVSSVSPDGAPELSAVSASPNATVWNAWLPPVQVPTLPDGVYTLPVLGSFLSGAFPPRWSDARLAHVRLLSPSTCPRTASAICPTGVLLKP